jgi:hypothetical protein
MFGPSRASRLAGLLAARPVLADEGERRDVCGVCGTALTVLGLHLNHHAVDVHTCGPCGWSIAFVDDRPVARGDLVGLAKDGWVPPPPRGAGAVTWLRERP